MQKIKANKEKNDNFAVIAFGGICGKNQQTYISNSNLVS